jgi:DNA-binding response OmpR family regulator
MKENKHRILIVDDDQDMLDSMRLVLEKNGYHVISGTTAEEGVLLFKTENPDFVIVDLMMEEVDAGTVMVKELKALGCDKPIYMLSSLGNSLSISTPYRELGLSGVLQKPVDFSTLLFILQEKLG